MTGHDKSFFFFRVLLGISLFGSQWFIELLIVNTLPITKGLMAD